MERVEKLATCVAPTARSKRGWVLLAWSVSVGAATPVCTAAFCRSDASRELFGRAYVGVVKATMSGVTTERHEKKQEGGWTCVRTIDRATTNVSMSARPRARCSRGCGRAVQRWTQPCACSWQEVCATDQTRSDSAMKSKKPSASSQTRSRSTRQGIWMASNQLTPSEIVLLQQSKKSIADYVQKELPERLKQRHLEHMLTKA